MALERYFALAPVTLNSGYVPGWVVADHKKPDPRRHGTPGAPVHEGTMDKDTAVFLADALNRGVIRPEDVANA